ncbi:hypothetical protein NS334_09740 [Sphingomonas endophytica]|uniref:Uncharacterized protein n=2 Tax=Sphingomonas endophytica TaxID=869719 RepID=A0A147I291_9SPHN|nr:hypothetical protein NS334_09740 [Sphingomonas endophytica]
MLDDDRAVVTTAPLPAPVAEDLPTKLSALEWSVVALARNDRLSSLRQPGRMAKALGIVFKSPHNPMLADERLEALRRIAVLGWHYGYTVPTEELSRFLHAGFTTAQYELMMDSIGVARLRAARH